MAIIKQNGIVELKKHVNAIHCTNNLSLIQRKLFNGLLYHAYPHLMERNKFEISASELCKLIGYNSNDYAKLKKALLGLITTAIEWNVIDITDEKKTSSWNASSILAAANLKNGICTYEYSESLKELLYRPEIYGRVDMNVMSQFKSSYGLALYENCIRFQNLAQTPWFTIKVFRKLMGVEDTKYKEFKDFKKRVINIAIREVNQYGPITITSEYKTEQKEVVGIRFKINYKRLKEENDCLKDNNALEAQLIKDFGLSVEKAKETLIKYETHYITEKIKLILNSNSFKKGNVKDLAALLIDALKKDYKQPKAGNRLHKEIAHNEAVKKEEDNINEIEHQKNKERYNNYVNEEIDKYLNHLPEDEKNNLINEFMKLIKRNLVLRQAYKTLGFSHEGIKMNLQIFVKDKFPSFFEKIKSFDEFMKIESL